MVARKRKVRNNARGKCNCSRQHEQIGWPERSSQGDGTGLSPNIEFSLEPTCPSLQDEDSFENDLPWAPVGGLYNTLLLDIGFQPLRVIAWQKAFCMGLTQRVEVISDHERPIRTIDQEYPAPAVVRLLSPRRPQEYVLRFSRAAVYRRDGYTCQYCARKLRRDQLTLDHVVPRHMGGGMSWTNIVTACRSCNARKGGRKLAETRLRLQRPPFRPRWKPLSAQSVGTPIPAVWRPWLSEKCEERL